MTTKTPGGPRALYAARIGRDDDVVRPRAELRARAARSRVGGGRRGVAGASGRPTGEGWGASPPEKAHTVGRPKTPRPIGCTLGRLPRKVVQLQEKSCARIVPYHQHQTRPLQGPHTYQVLPNTTILTSGPTGGGLRVVTSEVLRNACARSHNENAENSASPPIRN